MKGEVLSGPERHRRRSVEEKARIVGETMAAGTQVSEVARRHGVSRSLIYAWRRELRGGRGPETVLPELVPVVVAATDMAGDVLVDPRTGRNGQHGLTGLFRQSVFGRLGGYEDVNDADRLGRDPAMRWIVGGRAIAKQAASTSQMGRFETEFLAVGENLGALADLSGQWIDRVIARHPPKAIVLDMDSSVSPTHGDREGTAYNGHFACTCYHPLFVFNQFGDLEMRALRPGNVHSSDGWRGVLEPVVARYRTSKLRRYFRGDAAFAAPDIYEFLEAEGYKYTIRLKANAILQESIAHVLTRPVGRPPNHVVRSHASFSYQAGSWDQKRRVVAKVEWHPGELYPRVGFIVINLTRPARRVVAFYNQRGTAEQHIKEGKNAILWTRLSCRKFQNNAVRLQLHAFAIISATSCGRWLCLRRSSTGRRLRCEKSW